MRFTVMVPVEVEIELLIHDSFQITKVHPPTEQDVAMTLSPEKISEILCKLNQERNTK